MGVELALIGAAASAVGTGIAAIGQSRAANAQATADTQRAEIQSQWTERRALEERGAAQRAAGDEMRKARFAQSRLTALAGGSGAGVDDPTVMDLWGDIDAEGRLNASNAMAAGNQRAAGLNYDAALGRWGAESNARIQRQAARTALAGNLIGAFGQGASGMAGRYRSSSGSGYRGYYG